MEKFIYICNAQEFIKLIETFGEKMKFVKGFFQMDNIFIIQKDEKGEIEEYSYKDELFIKNGNGKNEGAIKFFAGKIANEIEHSITDVIYISVHPGGTNESDIKEKLKVNTELNNKEELKKRDGLKIFVTYHGSRNTVAKDFFTKDAPTKVDLINLNNAIINFVKPDIKKIFKKYKSNFLIELNLFNEFFDENNNVDEDKVKNIFGISNTDSIKKYKEALDNVNKVHEGFYNELGMIQKNDHD